VTPFSELPWRDKLAHVLAVWFGCGHVPKAPGTAGTIGALPLYLWLRPAFGITGVAIAAAIITLIGIWAAGRVAARTGMKDPQIVVIDEVAGVLVTWLGAPDGWIGTAVGLVLFRILDQLKPWPANAAEAKLRPALGIMFDDVFAGMWGAALLLGAARLGWLG
jgi:phosphatidylglycerophosphatase A